MSGASAQSLRVITFVVGLFWVVAFGGGSLRAAECPEEAIGEPGVVLVDGLSLADNRVGNNSIGRLDFLQEIEWFEIDDAAGSMRVRDGTRCGWVDPRFVKIGPPLRMRDLAQAKVGDLRFADNPLVAKLIIRNESRAANNEEESEPRVIVRKAPDKDAAEQSEIRLFEILVIHSEIRVNDETWYFIGDATNRVSARGLYGWVPKRDVILWPQREAVYPSPSVDFLEIYADQEFESGQGVMQILPRIEDSERRVSVNRLPLTWKMDVDSGRGEEEVYSVVTVAVRDQDLQDRELAPICEADQARCAQTINEYRARLADAMRNAGNVDILFIVDNTESMEPYREPILSSIGSAVERYGDKVNARFAFAFYGDYFPDDQSEMGWSWIDERSFTIRPIIERTIGRPVQVSLLDFGPPGVVPSLDDLTRITGPKGFDDPMVDLPEAALAGLSVGVRGVTWNVDARMRLVIWIGDDGNRLSDQDPAGLVPESAVRALKEMDAALVAINVPGREIDHWNDAFIEQSSAISEALGAPSLPTFPIYESGGNETLAWLSDAVETYLGSLFDASVKITDFAEARWTRSMPTNPVGAERVQKQDSPEIMDRLSLASWDQQWIEKVSGVDEARWRALYQTPQLVTEGWVRRLGPGNRPQLDIFVTMTHRELDALRHSLYQLCLGIGSTDELRDYFINALENLVSMVTGDRRSFDRRENEDLATFYRRVLHLPEEAFSLFEGYDLDLEKVIGEYERSEGNPAQSEMAMAVCRSAELLRHILDKKFIRESWLVHDGIDDLRGIPVFKPDRELKDFEWLWGLESGIVFYFVPTDFLPQKAG